MSKEVPPNPAGIFADLRISLDMAGRLWYNKSVSLSGKDLRVDEMKNGIRWALIVVSALILCASCVRQRAEAPSDTVGVGRAQKHETYEDPWIPEETDAPTVDPSTDPVQTDPSTDPVTDPAPQTQTDPVWTPDPVTPDPVTPDPVTPDPVTPDPAPADQPTYVSIPSDPDSLAPFGAINWYTLNGKYVYEMPRQNSAGMETIGEMYDWPKTYWDDKNKDNNDWYPGKVSSYDPATGEVVMQYDRYASTLAVLKKYGAIYRGDTTRKVIYLTFDCGYENGATGKILDTLKSRGVPATFFLTGPYVRTEHDLVARMLDEGHVVGSHTNKHLLMTTLSVDEVIDEMRQVEISYKEQFPDAPDMLYWRPPQGDVNEWVIRIEAKMGYRTVLWSFAYNDWSKYTQPEPDYALATMKAGMYPGCVYLLHAESATNAEVLGDFIDWVLAQGFVIEPLCGIE